MKHIYSILMLISLLFVGTACEDDYRDMVFFTGDAPIYQIGTCDNLIGSVNLYLSKPEGIIVGVDGGDGNYSIVNGEDAIVTAAFVKSESGYQRIQIIPKAEGETGITVRDGSGSSTLLRVKVDECLKLIWSKKKDGIVVTGEATEEQKKNIADAFTDFFTVKVGGRYEMIPDNESEMWEKGTLRVRPDDSAIAPMIGRYERGPVVDGEVERLGLLFKYNDEEHFYTFNGPDLTRMSVMDYMDFWEDVTEVCPVEVPVGCKVYHVERLSPYNQSINN